MITFKPIELDDKDRVQKYTLRSWRRNCDLSFSNLYSWRFLYRTEIAEKDGFLLFRFYADNQLAYMMPVGEGNLHSILEELMEDARSLGAPFRLLGVCVGMRAELESAFPFQFDFVADRDYLIMCICGQIWLLCVERNINPSGITSISSRRLIRIMNTNS